MFNRQIGMAKVCSVRKALEQLMLGRGLARNCSAPFFWLPCVRTYSCGSPVCHVVPVVVSRCVGGVWATDRKSAISFDDQAKPDVLELGMLRVNSDRGFNSDRGASFLCDSARGN